MPPSGRLSICHLEPTQLLQGEVHAALGAALHSVGIPKDSVLKYELALKADQFILIAHGTPDEVTRAMKILEATENSGVDLHLHDRQFP